MVTNAKGANDNGMLGDQAELLFTDGTKKIVDTDQDYSSMTGDLVTFEIEDGEYQLTEANDLTDGSNGNSGFDKKLSSPNTSTSPAAKAPWAVSLSLMTLWSL